MTALLLPLKAEMHQLILKSPTSHIRGVGLLPQCEEGAGVSSMTPRDMIIHQQTPKKIRSSRGDDGTAETDSPRCFDAFIDQFGGFAKHRSPQVFARAQVGCVQGAQGRINRWVAERIFLHLVASVGILHEGILFFPVLRVSSKIHYNFVHKFNSQTGNGIFVVFGCTSEFVRSWRKKPSFRRLTTDYTDMHR